MPGNPMSPHFATPLPSNASFDEIERRAWIEGRLEVRLIDLAYWTAVEDCAKEEDLCEACVDAGPDTEDA